MSLDIYFREPKQCPHCGGELMDGETLWEANITHNLNTMADEAGIYGIVWRPEENGIRVAGDLTERLSEAIKLMEQNPPRFEQHNAPNGWGLYKHFLPWLKALKDASLMHPNAIVRVSR